MARSLSYADAARLLGDQESKVVALLEKTASWLMLGTAPLVSEVLGWFDAKADLVRLSHRLVRDLSEHRSGLSRYGRTERIEAAHTVIVVAAFFEGLREVRLPAELTRGEQIALGAGGPVHADFVTQIMTAGRLLPGPERSLSDFRRSLRGFYHDLADGLARFLDGLAVVEDLTAPDRARIADALTSVAHSSIARYDEALLRLSTDFPEVAYWADRQEQRAVRAALAEISPVLLAIHTGQAPDQRRAGLAAAYRDDLDRPVVDTGDLPDGITVPTLGEAYLPPRFRVPGEAGPAPVSDDDWWSRLPVRDDLRDFLIGHLTSPRAVRAPLLVLGQPGSGKSVFTRVLSAGLPATEFLPVRVVLRETPSLDQIQDQVEYAIRAATGERLDWPDLVRSAGDALPVVLLDGFDELLQATGVSQTDYLERVAAFQRREAAQGRPVAVVVTSRIAVANRARTPAGTLTIRLEPFDEQQIATWLAVWNRANAAGFAARRLAPLATDSVLTHRHLAEQPLLLLMLALYDADGNALQRVGASLRQDQLYERLLRSFATREVVKQRPGLPARDLAAAVEEELRRLAVVAFAMFNRSALWVSEADLEADLAGLLGPVQQAPGGLRAALRPAELTLGRFFFVHRARAGATLDAVETYEFLHATFTEFFVARLTWQVLLDVAAQASASTSPFGPAPVHDDLLRALLSHQPLSRRSTVIDFLIETAWVETHAVRESLKALLLRLFEALPHSPAGQRYAGYQPSGHGEPSRYATYSANLLLLLVCVSDRVHASDLFPGRPDIVGDWSSQALLWQSQLAGGSFRGFIERLAVERITTAGGRDIRIGLYIGVWSPSSVNLSWSLGPLASDTDRPAWLRTGFFAEEEERRRTTNFVCLPAGDMTEHLLDALRPGSSDWHLNRFVGLPGSDFEAPVHAILELWFAPSPTAYQRCVQIATCAAPEWAETIQLHCTEAILDRLTTDLAIRPAEATTILEQLSSGLGQSDLEQSSPVFWNTEIIQRFLRCVLRFLGRGPETDDRLVRLMPRAFAFDVTGLDAALLADLLVRLHELGFPIPPDAMPGSREEFGSLTRKVARQRPDLVERLAPLAPKG
ncbi:hypothetical protein FHR83_004287 [Actinoplanes campanulatus]|uniref:NACHT N-terminal Helical domain-containing protein n=1 Tax=Actinoplanes campanulatus TaxID=113559 RepID=A0A7W5AHX6_9ACTN|nr:hypothetical protein [Actinoplanes campanulatus]MBB3096613.1 hypothetical protein [Actinoplanes campanulatus]GGN30188.1 hypothetical protein GCM10010109_49650 [Actinoplanes campanulatus]GID37152.1 hypothetical protein Aca09nite_36580 [Actinoplanes campanulatus]